MPVGNRFRHQDYTRDPPAGPLRVFRGEPGAPPESDAGRALRAAGVVCVNLVHGSFVGSDALGLSGALSRALPDLAARLRSWEKRTVDRMTGDAGNYTDTYARRLEESVGIPVRLFHWSSANFHLARCEAAVRLLDDLARLDAPSGGRVLLWGHSHGGNVLALASNLVGGDEETRRRFLRAARMRRPPTWPDLPAGLALDIVTFGTPVRYGWETSGYGRLLHVIHHRPAPGLPGHLARFPPDPGQGFGGDPIQQVGIAGTDFPVPFFSRRAERRLRALLEPGLHRRDLLARLRLGVRVPAEGESLLVDYGEPHDGHAVYTRLRWLPFHAEQVARRFYG